MARLARVRFALVWCAGFWRGEAGYGKGGPRLGTQRQGSVSLAEVWRGEAGCGQV